MKSPEELIQEFSFYREREDILIRDLLRLSSIPSDLHIEDGDETFFKYFIDDGLKIRSCLECCLSQFKSPKDGLWIIYCTKEHQLWIFNEIQKGNYDVRCHLCDKWFYRRNNE